MILYILIIIILLKVLIHVSLVGCSLFWMLWNAKHF
jgi:hypothetical protein